MVSLFKKTKKAIQNTQTYCYLYTNHRSFKCSAEKHFRITHSLFANPIILSAAETKGNKGVKKNTEALLAKLAWTRGLTGIKKKEAARRVLHHQHSDSQFGKNNLCLATAIWYFTRGGELYMKCQGKHWPWQTWPLR